MGSILNSANAQKIAQKFLQWIGLKAKLHNINAKPPLVSVRDIWWVSLGENIGSEMNGKSERFTRPAVILKKLSHNFFLVAPTTTQPHEGTWYVHIRQQEADVYMSTPNSYYRLPTSVEQKRTNGRVGFRASCCRVSPLVLLTLFSKCFSARKGGDRGISPNVRKLYQIQ